MTLATEKVVCHSQFPRGRGGQAMAGPHEKAPGLLSRQREQEESVARAFLVVSVGEKPTSQNSKGLRLANLNNHTELWV